MIRFRVHVAEEAGRLACVEFALNPLLFCRAKARQLLVEVGPELLNSNRQDLPPRCVDVDFAEGYGRRNPSGNVWACERRSCTGGQN
jgi:hypothetical protein